MSSNPHQHQQQLPPKDEFEKTHMIYWDVPLSQFHVNHQLYRPKPTLWSPVASMLTNQLILQFQLSLEQDNVNARCFLHHRTPGIPNQGVNYSIFAIRHDESTVPLTDSVRTKLNQVAGTRPNCKPNGYDDVVLVTVENEPEEQEDGGCFCGPPAKNKNITENKSVSWLTSARSNLGNVDKLIWAGDVIKLRACVEIDHRVWNPRRIAERRIREWKLNTRNEPGMMGKYLWHQVRVLQPAEPIPPNTDFVLVCPANVRIVAHKCVVGAFSPSFRQCVVKGKPGMMIMNSAGIGAVALCEALHFVYLRSLSPQFFKVPFNELLEVVRLFKFPAVLNWEIEKILMQIMDSKNAGQMNALAQQYGLAIISNMTRKAVRDAVDSGFCDNWNAFEFPVESKQASAYVSPAC